MKKSGKGLKAGALQGETIIANVDLMYQNQTARRYFTGLLSVLFPVCKEREIDLYRLLEEDYAFDYTVLDVLKRHKDDLVALQKKCEHLKEHIKIAVDYSCCGRGTACPCIEVVCQVCGISVVYVGIQDNFIKWQFENFRTIVNAKKWFAGIPKKHKEGLASVSNLRYGVSAAEHKLQPDWGK